MNLPCVLWFDVFLRKGITYSLKFRNNNGLWFDVFLRKGITSNEQLKDWLTLWFDVFLRKGITFRPYFRSACGCGLMYF